MTSQGHPIGKTILQSLVGASSSSSSGVTPDWDFIEDYHEIGSNACWNPAIEAHHISIVGLARSNSHNNSSKYPTIGGSKVSDAWIPSSNVVRNLNPDFNVVRLQTFMESIQRMIPHDSPLVALAQ
jgi:hypothetical protein